MSDRSCNPILAGKRSDLDAFDDAELHCRVEILHRLLIKVDDASWLERPNIIYFDDRSLVCRFDEREPRAISLSREDAAKESAQIRLNSRSPAVRAVVSTGRGQFAALAGAGTKRIVGRGSAYEWRQLGNVGMGLRAGRRTCWLYGGFRRNRTSKNNHHAAERGAHLTQHSETPPYLTNEMRGRHKVRRVQLKGENWEKYWSWNPRKCFDLAVWIACDAR